jgi:acyl-CoA synthetase (AMP-forming)/AMP-acid ligase II
MSGPVASRRPRSADDLYVLYTGGTTGQPKGVVWRMADAFFACVGGGDPRGDRGPVGRPQELAGRIGDPMAYLPAAPLVHAAGMWTTLRWLFAGSTVVLVPGFDPTAIWNAVVDEDVSVMNIVGDAMAHPLLDAAPTSSPLRVLGSGGATLSPRIKAGLLARFPELTIKDTFGSSETGVQGWSVHAANNPTEARFRTVDTVVLDAETLRPLPAGTSRPGVIARAGYVPLRYHGDPSASARTFQEIDGVRHALTGDLGLIEADGTVTVLGRGSQCINTGGEKVFVEEVESILRAHPDVLDAVVVGVPDPTWGQTVTAVVSARSGAQDADGLRDHCRRRLAGFKVPKRIVWVDEVRRGPAGKPDYTWAGVRAREDARTGAAR